LQATAPGLESKLGALAPAYAVAGNIASYFVQRFVGCFLLSYFTFEKMRKIKVVCFIF